MRASFWPIYARYGSFCKRPQNLLPQRPETSSTSAFPLSNKFIDGPPRVSTLVDNFFGKLFWQSVGGSSWSDAGSLSPLSLVLCPPTPRKAPATPAPLTLAHLITSPWSIGFYSSPDPQVLGGPAPMTASRGSPYFQPPKLDYLFPILFQSIQLESSFPSDRWLCIVCKNIFLIKSWMFKS